MDESSVNEERKALNRRREEIARELRSLTAQDANLDGGAAERRRDALRNESGEIDHRLAEIQLDEESQRRMEGGE